MCTRSLLIPVIPQTHYSKLTIDPAQGATAPHSIARDLARPGEQCGFANRRDTHARFAPSQPRQVDANPKTVLLPAPEPSSPFQFVRAEKFPARRTPRIALNREYWPNASLRQTNALPLQNQYTVSAANISNCAANACLAAPSSRFRNVRSPLPPAACTPSRRNRQSSRPLESQPHYTACRPRVTPHRACYLHQFPAYISIGVPAGFVKLARPTPPTIREFGAEDQQSGPD